MSSTTRPPRSADLFPPRPATLPGLLLEVFLDRPDHECLVLDDDRVTPRELCARVMHRYRALVDAGVEPHQRVGVAMVQSIDLIATVIAITLARAVAVPINSRYRSFELAAILPPADLSALVVRGSVPQERLGRALNLEPDRASDEPDTHETAHLYRRGDGGWQPAVLTELHDRTAGPDDEFVELVHRVRVRDLALLYHSSGTTSAPKGCLLTHEALTRTAHATAARMELRDDDRMLNPQPLFHIGAWQAFLAMLFARGTFVSMAHFDASNALELIESERITVLFTAFPTLTKDVVFHPNYHRDAFRRVRSVFTVGPPDWLRQLQEQMPHSVIVNAYGATEVGGSATMTRRDDPIDARITQGPPFPGVTVRIVDEAGNDVLRGTLGEILVRSPTLFSGYHGDMPDEPPEEWRSGDLGWLTQDGLLVYEGRSKDMLKVGGENVSALEVESFLQSWPGVKMAQVVGIADARYGEVPVAFVECGPEGQVAIESLHQACRDQLASFKVPRAIIPIDRWPMSSTKVKKDALIAIAEAEMARAEQPSSSSP
jgi:fatty-acyl-CoA synthase